MPPKKRPSSDANVNSRPKRARPAAQPPASTVPSTTTAVGGDTPPALTLEAISALIEARISSLQPPVGTQPTALSSPTTTTPVTLPVPPPGTDPLAFLQSHSPWVDTTTISQIVSGTLDVAHLVKLIPPEDRPRGAANMSLPTGLTFTLNGSTSTPQIVQTTDPSLTAFEKTFPTVLVLVQALSVYGAIRSLYDRDSTGVGTAIYFHICKLSLWSSQRLPWRGIIHYAIAHFRKYQASSLPSVWLLTDTELYTTYVARPPSATMLGSDREPRTAISPREHCRNWNSPRGCSYTACRHMHKCSTCNGEHSATACTRHSAASANASSAPPTRR